MKLLVVAAGALSLAGCAANMDHPTRTLADQERDRASCKAQAGAGSKVRDCMIAHGYVARPIQYEE
jgi:hypothetical protein